MNIIVSYTHLCNLLIDEHHAIRPIPQISFQIRPGLFLHCFDVGDIAPTSNDLECYLGLTFWLFRTFQLPFFCHELLKSHCPMMKYYTGTWHWNNTVLYTMYYWLISISLDLPAWLAGLPYGRWHGIPGSPWHSHNCLRKTERCKILFISLCFFDVSLLGSATILRCADRSQCHSMWNFISVLIFDQPTLKCCSRICK